MNKILASALVALLLLSFAAGLVGVWQIKPAQATTLFSDGFEEGNLNPSPGVWTSNQSGVVQSSVKYNGTYAAQLTTSYSSPYIDKSVGVYEIWTRFQWRCSALPASDGDDMRIWSDMYVGRIAPYLVLGLYKVSGSVVWKLTARDSETWIDNTTATNVPVIDTWYLLQLHLKAGSGAGKADFWVEGVKTLCFPSLANSDRGVIDTVGPDALKNAGGTNPVFYYDDVVFADAYIGGVDSTLPTFGMAAANSTLAGNATQISCAVSDDVGLSAWGFAWNNTGSWVNATKHLRSGTSYTSRYNGTWNVSVGYKISVQFWANDTTDNEAYSAVKTFTLVMVKDTTAGDGVADSDWTYRVSRNATSCYLIDSAGAIVYSNSDPSKSINFGLWNSTLVQGSVYVYPDTYNIDAGSVIGSDTGAQLSNCTLVLGDGTVLNRTGSLQAEGANPMFYLYTRFTAVPIFNFTLRSNGTGYIDCQGLTMGVSVVGSINCTFENLEFQNSATVAFELIRARYAHFENITLFAWDQAFYGKTGFGLNGVQWSTFVNITVDGNYEPFTRAALYLSDWEDNALWNGTYFNTFEKLHLLNFRRDGIYLNSGAYGYHVYNNTFTNCTIENNWQSDYQAVKFRPAQNCTFIDLVIKNCTKAMELGTGQPTGEAYGNSTGNYFQAIVYGGSVASLILGSDGGGQEVSGNFVNMTVIGGRGTYFSSGYSTVIKNNVVYMNFTDCNYGIYLEQGQIRDNVFFLNFSRCQSGGHPDMWHYEPLWENITNNTFKVYATSGNPNGLMDFVNGTQGNIVLYPYTGTTETEVSIVMTLPANITYTSPTVSAELYAYGGTIDTILWNCTFTNGTVAYANTVYTVPTSMTLGNGNYIFNALANNTDGDWDEETVMFSVAIVNHYYFSWNFKDRDNNNVNSILTYALYDGIIPVPYVKGVANLTAGTYTLVAFYYGYYVNDTALDTATQGNTTVNIPLEMKHHTIITNGYLVFDEAVTSLVINEQTHYNLTFTVATTSTNIYIRVPANASFFTIDGTNRTYGGLWTYDDANGVILVDGGYTTYQIGLESWSAPNVSLTQFIIIVFLALGLLGFAPLILVALVLQKKIEPVPVILMITVMVITFAVLYLVVANLMNVV